MTFNGVDDPASKASRLIEEMNANHAVLIEHGKTLVISERIDPVLNRFVLDRSTFHDIKLRYLTRLVTVKNHRGKTVTMPIGDYWLSHPARRFYSQLVFDPERQHPSDVYNLWRGFAVEPQAGSWSALRDHLHEVIAGGNDRITAYFLGWMAGTVQHPGQPGEVALVMKGAQGAGKGVLVRAFGHLFGQHFVHVSRTHHLTGNFNAHLQDAVLVFADEAVWGGDRQNEGALKALITEPTLPIERKGRDTYIVKNVIHLMLASNNEWAIPAGMDDRRFCVVDVRADRVGQGAYFARIYHELEHGGYAAMLHDLQHFDLSRFDHRKPPQTAALLDQKIRAFAPVQRWWFDKLYTGCVLRGHTTWHTDVSRDALHEDYIETATKVGVKQRKTSVELGIALQRMLPTGWPRTGRPWVNGERVRTYHLPPLADCREAFARALKQEIEWPEAELQRQLPIEEAP